MANVIILIGIACLAMIAGAALYCWLDKPSPLSEEERGNDKSSTGGLDDAENQERSEAAIIS